MARTQRIVERRGANHGLHVFLSLITCGIWAITGWPIATALGRKHVTRVPIAPPMPQAQQQHAPPPQAYYPPPQPQPGPYQQPPAGPYGQQPPPPQQRPGQTSWGQQ